MCTDKNKIEIKAFIIYMYERMVINLTFEMSNKSIKLIWIFYLMVKAYL